ncbi:uncharacterized protein LOC143446990 [Clavelina lepadiformis]|uniref:Uncharacterized protein n=1 Tax=Clavelina lepadiformis TaxID=159417 RepID=A0ABP0G0X9_CLALP
MSKSIPQGIPVRRVQLNHLSELPNDYGTTPGGTLYSTTPGGTRIIYDRSFLLKCRASPLSNTPPSNLPNIPGVTSPDKASTKAITKIVEENEVPNGKEHGVAFTGLPAFVLNEMNPGVDVYNKGPLQQYRQRSLVQQRSTFYEKASQQLCQVPIYPIPPVTSNPCGFVAPPFSPQMYGPPNMNSGDSEWLGEIKDPQLANRKSSPVSQLSLWRQGKVNQGMSRDNPPLFNGIPHLPPYNNLPMSSPNLSVFRGRGRGSSQRGLPGNLCKSMEQLFLSHQGYVPYAAYGQATQAAFIPAYGECSGREKNLQVDKNGNFVL